MALFTQAFRHLGAPAASPDCIDRRTDLSVGVNLAGLPHVPAPWSSDHSSQGYGLSGAKFGGRDERACGALGQANFETAAIRNLGRLRGWETVR
jgi:hypothetical protein